MREAVNRLPCTTPLSHYAQGAGTGTANPTADCLARLAVCPRVPNGWMDTNGCTDERSLAPPSLDRTTLQPIIVASFLQVCAKIAGNSFSSSRNVKTVSNTTKRYRVSFLKLRVKLGMSHFRIVVTSPVAFAVHEATKWRRS